MDNTERIVQLEKQREDKNNIIEGLRQELADAKSHIKDLNEEIKDLNEQLRDAYNSRG